jgi:hypothetical protein
MRKSNRYSPSATKNEEGIISKPAIEPECETKRVLLDARVPDIIVMLSQDLSPKEEMEFFSFVDRNSNVFTWQMSNLTGLSRSIIEHWLQVSHSTNPRKQKLRKMSDEKVTTAKSEVQRLLDA